MVRFDRVFIGLLLLLILCFAFFLVVSAITPKITGTFATVPELHLTEVPNYQNEILVPLLKQQKLFIDQPMLLGRYQHYPRNRPLTKNSIVAVEAPLNNKQLVSWSIEVSTHNWNVLFPSVSTVYWGTVVSAISSPVIVLKGEFPRCRYFSITSYGGVDISSSGGSLLGLGVKKDMSDKCNSTIAGDCSQIADYQIVPDDGSKNPFVDDTYQDGDPKFYTVYIVSPYYKGPKIDSPNVIPLTVYGLQSAVILYRIYGPFNPVSCNQPVYNSSVGFSTKGCFTAPSTACILPVPDSGGITILPSDGGSVLPSKDKSSSCKLGDKTCIQECVNYHLAKNEEPDCIQYTGNNRYCVCENLEGPCARYLNDTIKKCSNSTASIYNFCAERPKQEFSYCLDNVAVPNHPDGVDLHTPCLPQNKACHYVKKGLLQKCTAEKMFGENLPACRPFLNPSDLPKICEQDAKDPSTCAYHFNRYLNECEGTRDLPIINLYCKSQAETMKYKYNPEYDFTESAPSCCATPSPQPRYTCAGGYCIPQTDGEHTDPTCLGKCEPGPCTPSPFPSPSPFPIPTPSLCVKEKAKATKKIRRRHKSREGYQEAGTSGNSCPTHFLASQCNPSNQPFLDTNLFAATTTQDGSAYAFSGWTPLPEVFVKYSYNNYFIRLNPPEFPIESKTNVRSLMKAWLGVQKEIQNINPNSSFSISV